MFEKTQENSYFEIVKGASFKIPLALGFRVLLQDLLYAGWTFFCIHG